MLCIAGWSSPVARWAHNPEVVGSNPTPATKIIKREICFIRKSLFNIYQFYPVFL